jgi:hypothetical protein
MAKFQLRLSRGDLATLDPTSAAFAEEEGEGVYKQWCAADMLKTITRRDYSIMFGK